MPERTSHLGQQIGHYRLTQLLGKGGFAEVYLGEHIHLHTQAAVKLLHTQLANAEDVESFRREAQTIAHLIHPHIVRVLDFGVEHDLPYLVMDYAPRGTLRTLHPRETRLPLPTVVSYVKQIAEALQYAHDQRLIHRDIKPENMLMGRNHEILLSDFGIALLTQSSQYANTQNVAGTIAYMAPEQIQAHPRPASDQYALAIVVYEWLSGQRPFQGSYTEVAVKHSLMPPPPLRNLVPDIPPAIEQVVITALAKDPQQRFPTIRAFAHALEQASQAGYHHAPLSPTPSLLPSNPDVTTFVRPSSALAPPPLSSNVTPGATSPYISSSAHHAAPSAANGDPRLPSALPPYAYPAYPPRTPSPLQPGTPLPFQQVQPQRPISRRMFAAGVLGVAAASSLGTWYFLSRPQTSVAGPSLQNAGVTPLSTPFSLTAPNALLTYGEHSDIVWAVSWSPDGKYIVSGSKDGTAQVWDATTGKRILAYRSSVQPAQSDDWARAVVWSHDSLRIAVGFNDSTAQVVNPFSAERGALYHVVGPSVAVGWSPDGMYFASSSSDDSVRVYDVASGKTVTTSSGHNNFVTALAWSHDGKRIASAAEDGKALVWEVPSGKTLLVYSEQSGNIGSIGWSHDDLRIATASTDNTVKVWESATGHTLLTYDKHKGNILNTVAWSRDDKYLLSGGNDIDVHIWESATGNLVHRQTTYVIFGAAWSPDNTRFVTAGYNKVAQVWKIQ